MVREAERCAPDETGGVLLGYAEQDGDDVVVLDVLGPGPNAKHDRARFEPDGRWQAERVAERYEASGRVVAYLGDWHSHPKSPPIPSKLDTRTARRIAREKAARASEPLMLILGRRSPDEWALAALRNRRRALRPMRLEVFTD
ncbi:MAG: hypothetical protein QOD13_3049 [Thermoleophilaceae bacterium]|jgi:integrative and conjugative element protein (TIGR02256 family)|nr:hypothetical protein [Thermoleophilaceae bacterium]